MTASSSPSLSTATTRSELQLNALEDAGHPVIRIPLKDPLEVGAEFFRWELATAAAGVVLGVNPFDEPDVVRGRETTATLLSSWKKSRRLPEWPVDVAEGGLALLTNRGTKSASVSQGLQAFLGQAGPGDYIAILAYLAPTAENWGRLQELRTLLRDRLRVATTVGFGPRYLHSTGQLHKGGRANGLFLQLTGEDKDDMAIPGSGYGFATLKAAQALGDLQTLRDAGRRGRARAPHGQAASGPGAARPDGAAGRQEGLSSRSPSGPRYFDWPLGDTRVADISTQVLYQLS